MPYAGHKARVRVTGSPVTLTKEPTSTSDNLTFQITDATKRVLAPEANITVEVDPEGDGSFVVADPTTYSLDRLVGKVTFHEAQTGPVQISGQYLPLADVAEAYEYSYSMEGNNEDATTFGSEFVKRKQTLKDITGSISKFENVDETLFYDALQAGNTFLLVFYYDATLEPDIYVWAKAASDEKSAAIDGLIENGIDWEGTTDNDGRMVSLG